MKVSLTVECSKVKD